MERILHMKENFPHFQERVLRRLFYEHFSLGSVWYKFHLMSVARGE
jgi:hypothetical protein